MRQTFSSIPELKSLITILLPVALWAMLFVGLGAGSASEIWAPSGLRSFTDGIRAVLPFTVAGSAAVFIVYRTLQGHTPQGSIFGPLGLASLYGIIGFIAAFNSPDGSVALWWTGLYLSVPIVLWGIVWTTDPLDQIRPLVNATWLAVALAAGVLLLVAFFKLDLIERIQDPSLFLKCQQSNWLDLTSGRIRSTGVGRYAAITALIAISGMWMPKWRPAWSVLLVISLVLLLYTSARGSFVGFGVGAALILIIYMISSGRKALVTGLVVVAITLPVLWGTGVGNEFLESCLFRSAVPMPVTPLVSSTPVSDPSVADTVNSSTTQSIETSLPRELVIKSSAGEPLQSTAPNSEPLQSTASNSEPLQSTAPNLKLIPAEFYAFSGRQAVWSDGWGLFKESPFWGYGFQADRLMLGTHMHNSVMHAMLQTGLLGTIPFVLAIVFAWILLLRLVKNLPVLASSDKHLVIQCAGVLAFFTMRSFPESTGAFFGVDWLIIAVMLFYLQLVNSKYHPSKAT